MAHAQPIRFTALDDGRGGIELEVQVTTPFRDMPCGERAVAFQRWLDGLQARMGTLPESSDEHRGLRLLAAVARELEPVLTRAGKAPPAALRLSVSAAEPDTLAAALPPSPHHH